MARKSVIGALGGAAVGALVKVGGDWFYETSRSAWVSHRRLTLEHSRPRVLNIRKPQFPPKPGQSTSIIPQQKDQSENSNNNGVNGKQR
jgi:hypothetical protein